MRNYILLVLFAALPMMSVAEDKDEVAEATFRKAIEAAGGEKRFDTIKAPTMWMETGVSYWRDQSHPFVAQFASYWPKRWYRQLIEGQFSIGIAGEQVTLTRSGGGDSQKLSRPRQEAVLRLTRVTLAQLLYPLLEDDYTLSSVPGVEIAGKAAVGIKATHDSGSEVLLYFEKSTHLLVKTEAQVSERGRGEELVKQETFFSDHKVFGGVKLPGKYRIHHDGKLVLEGEKTAIKTHATIDPAWFGVEGPARVR